MDIFIEKLILINMSLHDTYLDGLRSPLYKSIENIHNGVHRTA